MSFLDPFRSFWQYSVSSLQSQYYFLIIATLGLLLAAVVAYGLGWGAAFIASPWFWPVVALLLVVGLFVGIRYGVPRLRERYFLRQHGSEYVVAGQESPEEFQAKFLKALQTLKGLPQLKGRDEPLYALPWYLLIGEPQSGKTAALKGADLFSPLIPPSSGSTTQNCDWWISNTAVILDTTGRYVTQADKARDRAEWYRLLRLLHRHREHEPINGLIIAVAADELALQPEEKLRIDASRLRERFEEAVQELGCDFPAYLLITKCDRIEGFSEFFSPLPPRVLSEVIGYVDDPPSAPQPGAQPARGEEALQRLSTGLHSVYDRLHRFRLSLLDGKTPEALHQPIFCFPEEFKVLQQALFPFAKPLFSFDTRYHTPLFRGIFFSSAQQQGTCFSLLRRQLQLADEATPREERNGHYFLHDLFHTILPRDRGLVTITAREQRKRGFTRIFGVGTSVGLVLLVAVFLVRAYLINQRILKSVDATRCPEGVVKTPARPALEEAENCRQVVQGLTDQNRQRRWWSTLWFTRSFRLEEELRERYVRNFPIQVLTPLNATLDRAVQATDDPLPLLLLLARRVRLSQSCTSPSGCPEPMTDDVQPDYALMLNPSRDRQSPVQDVTKLKATYLAYLLWQQDPKGALQQALAEDHQRLQRWLSAKQLSLERLLVWVNRRSPPITYEQYWELPPPLTTVAAPQIEAACTRKIWEQDLAAFLQQIQDAVPDVSSQLRTFRQQYITSCLDQWQRFLIGFPQGTERWKGPDRRQALALRLLTENSPYQRVLADAWENLSSWLPVEGGATAASAWTDKLHTYATAEQKQAYQDALKQIGAQLKGDSLPETSFKLVRDVAAEGKPPEEATNPLQRAWVLATQLSQGSGAAQTSPEGNLWPPLLQEPVRYVWRVLLEQANLHLQKLWAENVLTPVAGMPAAERLVALYGPGGKVESFTKQFLEPLLKGNPLPGEQVTLPPDFSKALDDQKQLSPILRGDTSYPVQVRASRRSDIEGLSSLLEDQTILSISCATKSYRITTRPRDFTETEVTVQWSYQSCGDVTLTIYFSLFERERRYERDRRREEKAPVAPPKRIQLTKRYSGPTGFLRFLQDFMDGSHRFQINDFDPNPDAGAVLEEGINFVNVYYYISVPPPLAKLTSALQTSRSPENPPAGAPPLT